MKKNPFFLFIFLLIIVSKNFSQDFNFYNPSNEMYLFSAYDEGANAFRYNPAVLGLKHKLNGTVNLLMRDNSVNGKVELAEYDILVNSGIFGISYRNGLINESNYSSSSIYKDYINTLSLGLGFGNKSISGGFLLEWQHYNINTMPLLYGQNNYTDRIRGGLGILYRPSEIFSGAFTLKTDQSFSIENTLAEKYTLGVAVRPLMNDLVTLMLDFGFIPRSTNGFFENHMVKIGFNINTKYGLGINANYARINDVTKNDFFNIGLSFNFPNSTVGYNNLMNKFTDRNNGPGSYKTSGSSFSFAFNLEKKKSIVPENKKILEITLSGSLQDYTTDDVFFGILEKGKRSIHEVIADIDNASTDPSIKGMLMKIYPLNPAWSGIVGISAQIEELTDAMERFKSHNKKITVYFPEDVMTAEYYIGTFADNIVLPEESVLFYGLSVDVTNFKQFLQKYGIDLQTFQAGKYKLTYQGLLDSTSKEGKEVINRVLDIVYEKMIHRISYGRNISVDEQMMKKISQPMPGGEAKRIGLADENGWYEDAKNLAEKSSRTSNLGKYFSRKVWDTGWSEPDAVAIIGVYGSITPGESEGPSPIQIPFLSHGRSTGSESVVRQLENAFSNPKVKAIILRVDSGGGSALASAEIDAAIVRLKKKYNKPLIVSMGGAAASGGYYVSSNADKIFADELTITGSIGVFFAKPNIDSLLQNQKIKVETFKRGENSDIGSLHKKLNDEEITIIQNLIDYYYDRFTETVAEGRKMTKEEVEQVAQGRVWLGSDAFNKKLVDEIGGLYEAIKYAKSKGNIGKRMNIIYYEVPGGENINDLVTSSILQYFQRNIIKLLGFDDDNDGFEIKY